MKERGFGRVYRPTYTDKKSGRVKQSSTWWPQYHVNAQRRLENSHSKNKSVAQKLLKRRLGEIGHGRLIGPDIERTRFEDLCDMLVNDYKANGRKSINRVLGALKHLAGFFALNRAIEVTPDRVSAYVSYRQDERAANATVNRELAALKRMFHLGKQVRKVGEVPYIRMLQEDNARKGFFERYQLEAVLNHLPEDVRPVVEVAYVTGWRVRSELLTRQWQHVDLQSGWLRLEPGETKNRKGRMFPLTPGLRAVLERQRQRTDAAERIGGKIIPWVFHRAGQRIRTFDRSWRTAIRGAGIPDRILHDLRRTAVRNLERAGVPRSDAMAMVGHQTESIYRRYAISDEASLKESGAKLAAFHEARQPSQRTIVPFQNATTLNEQHK